MKIARSHPAALGLLFLSSSLAADDFVDVAAETGLDFQHFLGATGDYLMPEIMGSGVALLDYDLDGDLDVYLLQGALIDPERTATDLRFPAPAAPGNRLFRNDLIPSGKLRFVDATDEAGVGHQGFGMGVAVGDYDNDGDPDMFVTNYGRNALYRNEADGSFSDVTDLSSLVLRSFSASAAFVDYDGDGDLDLFETRYNAFTVEGSKPCLGHAGARDYCGPKEYFPLPDRIYRNDGELGFVDASEAVGITQAFGNGLGVVVGDFNGDGRVDIYVANDKMPNQLWINQGEGKFIDDALMAGVALNVDGMAEAGMGVTAGDIDADGDEDILVTHLRGETNTLYINDGSGVFDDATAAVGLGHASRPFTGFGVKWIDYDNDGALDLFVANGEVRVIGGLGDNPFPYNQTNQLYRNAGDLFEDVSSRSAALAVSQVSRGVASGDIDNDGDIDLLVQNANGPAQLLLNQVGSENHWLQVRLRGTAVNRDGYGARVALHGRDGSVLWRRAGADGSYLSASDPRIHFGLGRNPTPPASVLVLWPDGSRETWSAEELDQVVALVQGTGQAAAD